MVLTTDYATHAGKLRAAGDNIGAIAAYRKHLNTNANDTISMHNLAAALGDVGQHKEVVKVLKNAFSKGLNAPESWLVYARSLGHLSRFKDALEAYKQGLTRAPNNANVQMEYAQLHWMVNGDLNAALSLFHEALKIQTSISDIHVMYAEVIGQMGDASQQFDLLNQAYASSGNHPRLAYFLSKAALKNEKFELALQLSQLATKAFPQELDNAINACNCHLAMGQANAVLAIVERFLKTSPNNQHLIALQATAYRLLGDERYPLLYDYTSLVKYLPLGVPKGWSSLSGYISDLEAELEEQHKFVQHPFFLSVRNGSQIPSIARIQKPAIQAFSEAMAQPVNEYVNALSGNKNPMTLRNTGKFTPLPAWSVLLPPGGYHVSHVHQEGWLSAACHIRPAENEEGNVKAGWLALGEPGSITQPKLDAEMFIEPKSGHLAMFPSYMWHGTVGFNQGKPRLTVALDIVPG